MQTLPTSSTLNKLFYSILQTRFEISCSYMNSETQFLTVDLVTVQMTNVCLRSVLSMRLLMSVPALISNQVLTLIFSNISFRISVPDQYTNEYSTDDNGKHDDSKYDHYFSARP